MYSTRRVATPTHTTRTPVASGSSVPAWPRRVSRGNHFCARLRAAREVMPWGLSRTSRPSVLGLRIGIFYDEVGRVLSLRQDRSGLAEVRCPCGKIITNVHRDYFQSAFRPG